MKGKKILINTFGSYGDVHPYLAVGQRLRAMGHEVAIATSASYQAKVESEGLCFHAVRPDVSLDDSEMLAYVMDRKYGSERILRYVSSVVRQTYEDVLPLARQANLMVTHPMTAAAVAIAEKYEIPWVSSVLAPISFLSAFDPPVPAPFPALIRLRALGVPVMRAIWNGGKRSTRAWVKPILEFRRELGLDTSANPIFDGQHSPQLVLGLFSPLLGEPQPDWPPQTVVTGFPFFDSHHEQRGLPEGVERFLDEGCAPIVFTLGSSAVNAAGDFYRQSIDAAGRLGLRALLLAGKDRRGVPERLPPGVLAAGYSPHSEVFPRAAAIVHQGGVGTTAQAMRAGRPMLVVPFSHDQPDNGHRIERLGAGLRLMRDRYTGKRAAVEIRRLLDEARFATAAEEVGKQVRSEDGAEKAAEAIARVACVQQAF